MKLLSSDYGLILIIIGITAFFSLFMVLFAYRLEKNSFTLARLSKCFLGGMLVPVLSVPLLLFIRDILFFSFNLYRLSFPEVSLFAPLVEEATKGLAIYYLSKVYKLDTLLDYTILGITVGAGFAMVENVIIGLLYLSLSDVSSTLLIVLYRGLFVFIGHPVYSGIFGYTLGQHRLKMVSSPWQGYGLSFLLHALWNTVLIFPVYFYINYQLWISLFGIVILSKIVQVQKVLRSAVIIQQALIRHGYFSKKQPYRVKFLQ